MEDLSMCIAPLDVQAFYNLDIKRVDPMDLPPYARTKAMNRCGYALVPKVFLLFCFVFVLSPLNTLVTTTPCATPAAGGAAPLAPPSLLTHTHTHAHAHAPSYPHHHPTHTHAHTCTCTCPLLPSPPPPTHTRTHMHIHMPPPPLTTTPHTHAHTCTCTCPLLPSPPPHTHQIPRHSSKPADTCDPAIDRPHAGAPQRQPRIDLYQRELCEGVRRPIGQGVHCVPGTHACYGE